MLDYFYFQMQMNKKQIIDFGEVPEVKENRRNSESLYGSVNLELKDGSEQNKNKLSKFWQNIPFTGNQMVVILLLCYGNFSVGSAFSILAPFFPREVIMTLPIDLLKLNLF